MCAQTAAAMSAAGKALQECAAFSHGTTHLVWSGPGVLRDALLIGLIGLPVDIALMMLLDQNLPLIARQMPDALLARACGVECQLHARLAIDVGARIDGVHKNLVNRVVTRLDPTDLGMRVHLQWELMTLIAQPQPNAARRAGLGEAGEEGVDGSHDSLVGMTQHLAVGLSPHESDRQATPELTARRLVADSAIEACAQHVQLGLAHGALEPEQQAVIEQRRVIDAVGVADQRVGETGKIDETMPVGVVARQT